MLFWKDLYAAFLFGFSYTKLGNLKQNQTEKQSLFIISGLEIESEIM